MKSWLYHLRRVDDLFYWEILTPAGGLVCRSLLGFSTEELALSNLRDFHPVDHF
jgi:hypothetical protein